MLYIGIMSGTSCDGVDLILAKILNHHSVPKIQAILHNEFPSDFRKKLQQFIHKDSHNFLEYGQLDVQLATIYANAVNKLLQQENLKPKDITAIGCHGQTVYHAPTVEFPFSLQLGDPNTLSALTNIDVVCDFRRRDIALGGQGAPLTPIFHNVVFKDQEKNRAIINIGGIANISYLPAKDNAIYGFDCGPGNILMDLWIQKSLNKNFDQDGKWAKSGLVNKKLLENFLSDPFINQKLPKSTGREHFNLAYINNILNQTFTNNNCNINAADIQATLSEFTVQAIANNLEKFCGPVDEIYLCGGGANNKFLLDRLQQTTHINTFTTANLEIEPQLVESCAFAWLAFCHINKIKFNLQNISGSQGDILLGGMYCA